MKIWHDFRKRCVYYITICIYFVYRIELCQFSGYKIYPGHGKKHVKIDGKASIAILILFRIASGKSVTICYAAS